MSVYLRQFMQLCLLTYYDCFGQHQLVQATYCFDYWIGAIRLSKQQVRKESVTLSIRDYEYNLLDVITQAYAPGEIFGTVYGMETLRTVYEEQSGVDYVRGVQGRYRQRMLDYFDRSYSQLTCRESWPA